MNIKGNLKKKKWTTPLNQNERPDFFTQKRPIYRDNNWDLLKIEL